MGVLTREHIQQLYIRFATIYEEKFGKTHSSDAHIEAWYDEWYESLADIAVEYIRPALAECKLNHPWPPSIAEFRRICEAYAGVPSSGYVLNSAINRKFEHPLTKMVYDKIGKWAFENDKEEVLRKKVEDAYKISLSEYRANPDAAHEKLKLTLQAKPEPKLLPKIPSKAENLDFKKRLQSWSSKVAGDKKNSSKGHNSHPTWDEGKVTPNSKKFDQLEYDFRRNYLINLPELDAGTLNAVDWYDRIRFIREIQAERQRST